MEAREASLREELVRGCKVLFKLGISDFIGHLSARLDDDRFIIKPRPVSWYRLTEDDLIVLDMNGKRLDNVASERPVVREWPLHTEVYRSRLDVESVLHCHPTNSVLMAALGIEWEPINRDAMLFPYGVPIWDNRECLVQHQTMADTREFGTSVAESLGNTHYAVILAHHGIVVAHNGIGNVVRTSLFLERAAQAHLTAASIRQGPIMSAELKQDIYEMWTVDKPGFGLSSPSRVVADEQWQALQGYYLDDTP